MNKVIIINLSGRAYQLEDEGYTLLKKYMATAEQRLQDNPDKQEILTDFEQAIAEKCDQHLSDHKTVITAEEIATIIKQLGPVEGEDDTTGESPKESSPTRQLYRIREGAVLSGVCNGLAVYFNIDPRVMRLLFVVGTILTHGFGLLLYIILAIVMPEARTPEQKAAARGMRFNAQEVLGNAEAKYSDKIEPAFAKAGTIIVIALRVTAAFFMVVGMLAMIALSVAWVVLMWTLTTNAIPEFGPWMIALWITSGFYTVFLPVLIITVALRRIVFRTTAKSNTPLQWVGIVTWIAALSIFLTISITNNQKLDNLAARNDTIGQGLHGIICSVTTLVRETDCTPPITQNPHVRVERLPIVCADGVLVIDSSNTHNQHTDFIKAGWVQDGSTGVTGDNGKLSEAGRKEFCDWYKDLQKSTETAGEVAIHRQAALEMQAGLAPRGIALPSGKAISSVINM